MVISVISSILNVIYHEFNLNGGCCKYRGRNLERWQKCSKKNKQF